MNEHEAIDEVLEVARDLVEAEDIKVFAVEAPRLMAKLRKAVGVLERCGHYGR